MPSRLTEEGVNAEWIDQRKQEEQTQRLAVVHERSMGLEEYVEFITKVRDKKIVEDFKEALAEEGFHIRTATGPSRALPRDADAPSAWRAEHEEEAGVAAGCSIQRVRRDCSGGGRCRPPTP